MKQVKYIFLLGLFTLVSGFLFFEKPNTHVDDSLVISYEVNLYNQELQFFWKGKDGKNYLNAKNLSESLEKEGKNLVFAVNGGMYNKDLSPQGLYIENGIEKSPLDTQEKENLNFYMKPNGVFNISKDNAPSIVVTKEYKSSDNTKYATQSGPMLIIDGNLHPKFSEGSKNLNIRNGVGILPNGNVLFAMSKSKINFFDFATYFKQKGCENALYLDGYVSRTYLPSKDWVQTDGNFGVIIGEVKRKEKK